MDLADSPDDGLGFDGLKPILLGYSVYDKIIQVTKSNDVIEFAGK